MGKTVRVTASGRLHLGFLDLHGGLGRRFGGVGLALDAVRTQVECARSTALAAEGPDAERVLQYARRLLDVFGASEAVSLHVHEAIPKHSGLGSGTQLALAVGVALRHLFGWDASVRQIGTLLGRGTRSGIGLGAFEQGGFLVDGGRGDGAQLPQIIARHPFPEHWRIVLLLGQRDEQGLSGEVEQTAFGELPEFPSADAAHLCRLTLMRILPALLESDFPEFARGIGELQQRVGDHFAPAQGGRFTHPAIARLLKKAGQLGFQGTGQSSWGPTGFVLADSETQAHALLRKLQPMEADVAARIVGASDRGHRLAIGEAAATALPRRQAS